MTSTIGRDPDRGAELEKPTPEVEYFLFRLGHSIYAVAPASVAHVAAHQRPVRVPSAPDHFLGVVHLRGRVVAVADLPRVLGLVADEPVAAEDRALRLLTFEVQDTYFAAVTPAVIGLCSVPTTAIAPSDEANEQAVDLFPSQFETAQGIATVIDIEALYRALASQGGGGS